ncbi:MAG: pyridoxal phosphate-dependent class II aminotransferase [Clostridia bacterium]|nr:pyridoxal phosphate-dependent class II aminotransferase [Clostridia bacterium]
MTVFHGGDVWQGATPEAYLDFSANLNPEGPPDWVVEAMGAGLERARFYPDLEGRAARRGMAGHLGLDEACVLVTSGGIEAAALAARLPGRHVIAQPTFQEYGHLCGDFDTIEVEKLHEYPFSDRENVWICNPNNPTGAAVPRDTLLALLQRARAAGARLIVDEAFIEYCFEHSVADKVADDPALIVLGSLTKILAIPGIRLGYMAAHPDVIGRIGGDLHPWRVNCVAEAVAAALPGHRADFDAIRRRNDVRREMFARDLAALGVRVYPSNANFLLCDFGRDMRPTIAALREKRILLRPCGMFPGLTHGHVRLCVRTEAENRRLIEALRESV